MALGDIQHSELPDNLLHEPKGASTAGAGTLYVADGAGSGSFKKVPLTSLDFAQPSVADIVPSEMTPTLPVNGVGLSQSPDGVLVDVPAFVGIPQGVTTGINKLSAEVYRIQGNQDVINDEVAADITELNNKLNEVIAALKGVGIFHE